MNYDIFKSDEITLPPEFPQTVINSARNEESLSERPVGAVGSSLKNGYFFLAVEPQNQEILGWIEVFPLWKNWWGMFSIYVYPKYRKRGLGSALLHRALNSLEGKSVYGATSNPRIKKILLERGCKRVRLSDLPVPLLLTLVFKRYKNLGSIIKIRKFARRDFEYFLRENV